MVMIPNESCRLGVVVDKRGDFSVLQKICFVPLWPDNLAVTREEKLGVSIILKVVVTTMEMSDDWHSVLGDAVVLVPMKTVGPMQACVHNGLSRCACKQVVHKKRSLRRGTSTLSRPSRVDVVSPINREGTTAGCYKSFAWPRACTALSFACTRALFEAINRDLQLGVSIPETCYMKTSAPDDLDLVGFVNET
jgi:hypothetical protein